jgi:hypothetical protein
MVLALTESRESAAGSEATSNSSAKAFTDGAATAANEEASPPSPARATEPPKIRLAAVSFTEKLACKMTPASAIATIPAKNTTVERASWGPREAQSARFREITKSAATAVDRETPSLRYCVSFMVVAMA